jgi:hypothetical protein
MSTPNQDDLKTILVNPYNVVQIDSTLAQDHELLVSKEEWVQANSKLIEEIGAEAWLRLLLDALRKK